MPGTLTLSLIHILVSSVEADKNKVNVTVSMFGRETPVELELDQVETLDE